MRERPPDLEDVDWPQPSRALEALLAILVVLLVLGIVWRLT